MSFGKNIIASYASQIYSALAGIVMLPIYIRYLGVESYGLVGFFTLVQILWFSLLDVGLTPTILRETARFRGGESSPLGLRLLLRSLEGIFLAIAITGTTLMMMGSAYIASGWLNAEKLPLIEVQHSIVLMAAIVGTRFISCLYRGVINGFESLVWLNGFNVVVATFRFVLVIPFFIYVGTSSTDFFSYQLAVAVGELLVLSCKTYTLLPRIEDGQHVSWQWNPVRSVLKTSLSFAFAGVTWTLITQTDKLVLSKLLTLEEYAYFILAVTVASGVMIVSTPISYALIPRLTTLSAEGDEAGLYSLYSNATQIMGMIAVPAALVLAFFSEQVLWAWTGDIDIAREAGPILSLYALGNVVLALAAFPYYLQFAKGDLKLHLIGCTLYIVLFVPVLIWATINYGAIGAGYSWLAINTMSFVFLAPKVHRRFAKGLHLQWLLRDVGPTICLTLGGAILAQYLVNWPKERVSVAISLSVVSLALLIVSSIGTAWLRENVLSKWRARLSR